MPDITQYVRTGGKILMLRPGKWLARQLEAVSFRALNSAKMGTGSIAVPAGTEDTDKMILIVNASSGTPSATGFVAHTTTDTITIFERQRQSGDGSSYAITTVANSQVILISMRNYDDIHTSGMQTEDHIPPNSHFFILSDDHASLSCLRVFFFRDAAQTDIVIEPGTAAAWTLVPNLDGEWRYSQTADETEFTNGAFFDGTYQAAVIYIDS